MLQQGFNVDEPFSANLQGVQNVVEVINMHKGVHALLLDASLVHGEMDGLVHVLHLIVMGVWLSVGRHHAVDAEGSVVWLVTKVASIEIGWIC